MAYKTELQNNNADLQSILDTINAMSGGTTIETSSFIPTNSGGSTYKSKFSDNNIDLQKLLEIVMLLPNIIRITYDANGGTFVNGTTNIVGYRDTDKKVIYGVEEKPTKDKYVITGWYLDKECTDDNIFNLNNITSDVVVYAKWGIAYLVDFEYIENSDGTYTLTAWKGTLNGEPSTELVIPDNSAIIL